MVTALVLNALAESAAIEPRIMLPLLAQETIDVTRLDPDPVNARTCGESKMFFQDLDGRLGIEGFQPAALVPGSFNPVHEGHWLLAAAAAKEVKGPVAFELSATNVDKLPLSAPEIRRRLSQFVWRAPVWVTRAPTFAAKADLFPGMVFAMGVDTAARLVDPRYHEGSLERMRQALNHIRSQGCRFLVAGREDEQGRFLSHSGLELPEEYRDLFGPIAESACRSRMSSTALRKAASHHAPIDSSDSGVKS
jgi:Cytidylyltransferase-like